MQTSILNRNEAYNSIIEKLPKKRKEVFNVISVLGKASLENIAKFLKCRPSDISGRITELKKCFLIKEFCSADSRRTGNPVTVYILTTEDDRIDSVNEKFIELRTERDRITNDLNLNKALSQALRRIGLDRINKINKEIKALKKVI
jgi:DNA-binding Lrp family transcriptional regulator